MLLVNTVDCLCLVFRDIRFDATSEMGRGVQAI